jgi:polysaccharide biosynthesis protein PslH
VNILFIAPYVPSPIRVRPYHFVRELSRRHEVTLLAVGSKRDGPAIAEMRRICRSVEVVPLGGVASLHSLTVAAVRGEPLQSAVCQSSALRQRLDALICTQKFDVAHVEHLRAVRLHSAVSGRLPVVFDAVDCISLLLERTLRSSHSPWQRAIAALELQRTRRFEAALIQRLDRVIVTSRDDAAAFHRLEPTAKPIVIANGVDLDRFRPLVARPREATIVFSGKMSYHANVSAVLHFVHDILPLVRLARHDVRVWVVGSSPPPAIQRLARDPAIRVTGQVPDMRAALAGATVAVCPVTVKVGIQNKVLEAMAMAMPVVCSSLGASGLDARAERDFLVAEDSRAFAHSVLRVLDDPALARQLGESGRRYVETHHRWDVATTRLEAVYASLIDQRQKRAA